MKSSLNTLFGNLILLEYLSSECLWEDAVDVGVDGRVDVAHGVGHQHHVGDEEVEEGLPFQRQPVGGCYVSEDIGVKYKLKENYCSDLHDNVEKMDGKICDEKYGDQSCQHFSCFSPLFLLDRS